MPTSLLQPTGSKMMMIDDNHHHLEYGLSVMISIVISTFVYFLILLSPAADAIFLSLSLSNKCMSLSNK